MKREKICHVVRVIIALPVMAYLLIAMANAFRYFLGMGMVAAGVPLSQHGFADLLALVMICLLAKHLYLWLYGILRFCIR